MADISLYLTNVNVSLTQNMDLDKSPNTGKDFESVELGDLERRDGEQKEKAPRRIIHFSSGETMEEYSTDEEDGEEKEPERKDLLTPVDAVRSQMTWGPYFWFHMWRAATSTISACDYVGERMASLFGITSAKYQYAIDEYYRMKKEKEEDDADNRLSEEAERYFDKLECHDNQDEEPMTDQPEVTVPSSSVSYEVENDLEATPTAIRVPAIVTAT